MVQKKNPHEIDWIKMLAIFLESSTEMAADLQMLFVFFGKPYDKSISDRIQMEKSHAFASGNSNFQNIDS